MKEDEPIDVVFTWVNGSDLAWMQKRNRYLDSADTGSPEAVTHRRWRDNDELRFALRGIHRNIPWVNKIYVVSDDQKPEWINEEHPSVEFVSHRAIFPDEKVLPTFNSHAIESCIHRIPGLAERFVYFNDDFVPVSYVDKTAFFRDDGLPLSIVEPYSAVSKSGARTNPYVGAMLRAQSEVTALKGWCPQEPPIHAPYAMRKTLCEELELTFQELYRQTRANRFRSVADIPPVSVLYPWYWATERKHLLVSKKKSAAAVGGINVNRPRSWLKWPLVALNTPHILVLNDGPGARWLERRGAKYATQLLKWWLPNGAPWEREG